MTWHDANDATRSGDCAVTGCTGVAGRSGICSWHERNGTPADIRYSDAKQPRLPSHTLQRLEQAAERDRRLRTRITGINRRLRELRAERDQLQDQLDRAPAVRVETED